MPVRMLAQGVGDGFEAVFKKISFVRKINECLRENDEHSKNPLV